MDAIAVELLGDRVVQLEGKIQTLSRNLDPFQDQGVENLPPNLPPESEQLINIVNTLVQSTAGTSSRISEASSNQAPTVKDIDKNNTISTIAINNDEFNYASSLHGAPIGLQARQRINAWISATSSTPASTVKDVSVGLDNLSLDSAPVSTQFTQPSTVQRSSNIRAQLAEARLKKAQELMAEKHFTKAIPFFERSIEELKSNPHYFKPETTLRYLQLNLTRAMVKSHCSPEAVEPILRVVLNDPEASAEERSDAAHILASLFLEKGSANSQEVKDLGELAVTLRAEIFGQDDPKTHKSIALIASICAKCGDPDHELWRAMLPQSYEVPLHSIPTISPYSMHEEGRIFAIVVSSDGKLLVTLSDALKEPGEETIAFWKLPEGTLAFETSVKRVNTRQPTGKQSAIHDTLMALSPDNKLLVVGSKQYERTGFPSHLGVTPSGTAVACHNQREGANPISFQPNGDLFAWTMGEGIEIAQYKDGKWKTYLDKITHGFGRNISIGAFSHDNKSFAAIVSNAGIIVLFDIQRRVEMHRLNWRDPRLSRSMVFSPDGHFLIGLNESIIMVHSSSGKEVRKFDSEVRDICAMTSLAKGKIVVAGFTNETRRRIKWSETEIG